MKQVNMEKTPKSKFFGYKTKHSHKNQFQTWFEDDAFDDDENIKNSSPIGTPESVLKTPVQSFSTFNTESNTSDVYNSSPQFRVGWNEGSTKISCEMSSPVNIHPVRRRIRRCPDNVASKVLNSTSAISIKKEESDCDIQHCINLAKRLLESTAHPVTEESVDISNEVTNEVENIEETNDNIDLLDDSSNELMILCSQAIEESVSKTRAEKHLLTPEHHRAKRFKENTPALASKTGTNEGNTNEPNKRNLFKCRELVVNQPNGHRNINNTSRTGTNEITANEPNKRSLFKSSEIGVNQQPNGYRDISHLSRTGTNEVTANEPNKRSLFKCPEIGVNQPNGHRSISYPSRTGTNEGIASEPNKHSLFKCSEKGVNQPNGHRNIVNDNHNNAQRKNNLCNKSVTNTQSIVNSQTASKVKIIQSTHAGDFKTEKSTSTYGAVSDTIQDDMDSFLDGEDDLFSSVDFNFLDSVQNNSVKVGSSNSKKVDLPENVPLVKREPVKAVVKYTKEQIEQRRKEASMLLLRKSESVKPVSSHQIEQRRVEANVLLVKKPEPIKPVPNLVVKYTKEQIEQRRIEAKKRLLFNKKHRSM